MHPGIWQRVLKDKYFPHLSVISWLRSADPSSLSGSQTWKNLLNALTFTCSLAGLETGGGGFHYDW
jgi:hypothetical protein